MAFEQARSGVCDSGAVYAGWTKPSITIKINGTDRTNSVLDDSNFALNLHADGTPATLTFTLKNITPTVGQEVALLFTTPDDYLFAGTLLQAEAVTESAKTPCVFWYCTAVGYQWLMDRYDRVLAKYRSVGVNVMVADILNRFTNGSFRVGYIPSSLGNLDMDFTYETVTGALARIAKAANAFWRVLPLDGVSRIVDLYDSYPEASPATVTESSLIATSLKYTEDLTQVRTRTLFQGTGSTATVLAPAGQSFIAVDDVSPFLTSGGKVVSGLSLITYAGISVINGQGFLNGVTGILYDIAQGDSVDIVVETVDAAAETALATRLGGGLSGQATNYLSDGRLSASESASRGTTDLAVFSAPLKSADWTYKRMQRWLRVGQSVTMNITTPVTVSGSFRIQAVQWKPYGIFGGTHTDIFQSVQASGYVRTMTDLLGTLPG